MKMNFVIYFLTFVFLFCAAQADSFNKIDVRKMYSELVKKEAQEVSSYSGFFFNTVFVDKLPNVSVSYVSIEKPSNIKMEPLLFVKSEASSAELEKVANKIRSLGKIQDLDITMDVKDDDVRFNFLNNKNKVIYSEVREIKNGFVLETSFYADSGKILSLTFYSKLRVNEPGENHEFSDKPKVLSLNNFSKDKFQFDFDDESKFKKNCYDLLEDELGHR